MNVVSVEYYSSKRRAKMKRGDDIDPLVVFERDNWICQLCLSPIDPSIRFPDRRAASIDHIIPFGCGGTHVWSNVQSAHRYCNEAKGDDLTVLPLVEYTERQPPRGRKQ